MNARDPNLPLQPDEAGALGRFAERPGMSASCRR